MTNPALDSAEYGAKRAVTVIVAVFSALLLALGTVLPSWRESDHSEQSFSLLTVFGLFEDQTYASDLNRLLGALAPFGFGLLLVCTVLAFIAATAAAIGRQSYRFLRLAKLIAGLLSSGALVPGVMTLIALGDGAARIGMALYLPGVIGYAILCFSSLNATWALNPVRRNDACDMR